MIERGETFDEHQEHARLDYLLGDPPRAALWPLLVVVFAIAFASSCLTLTLSAASSTPGHREATGTVDGAAVRAIVMDSRTSEDPPPASNAEESPAPIGNSRQSFTTTARDDPARILAIIRNAALELGVDAGEMERVALCESSLRPDAIGDGGAAVGLFQWHLAPFEQHARRLFGHDVGDRRADPVTASLVTAYTVSRQGWGIWTCKP